MLVLAGPGSGKTTVISERVRYLIEEKGVEPGRILTITFTKAAALEMQRRCQNICPRASAAVFGTFHSVFYHFLRKSEKYQKFTHINEKQKKEMMKKLVPIGTMTSLQHAYLCESMLKKISYYKNSQSDLAHEGEDFYEIMRRYSRLCVEQEKLDFDDMLVLCLELFLENKQELYKWQNKFSYILVDEFQDINQCQYEIVKLLTQKSGNLFVVGDDDQAIYSFRGSDPGYMKQFLLDFPNARKTCLEENYRSGEGIVALAGKSISNNEERFFKNIQAMRQFAHEVIIKEFDTMEKEAQEVMDRILCLGKNIPKENIAVLVRTNAKAEYLAELFYQRKIPCSVREKRTCFYDNPWVRDIFAVLRFASCGQKRKDFFVFMNKPFRAIERCMLPSEQVQFEKLMQFAEVAQEAKKIKSCIELIQGLDPYAAVLLVLNGLKYRKYLDEIAGEDVNIRKQIDEVIEELLERTKCFDSIPQLLEFVQRYTETYKCEEQEPAKDAVQILTYHASKGLEFDCVFLPMLNQGIVPHGHMLTQKQMEEERRMFYVAMTRAKKYLWLSGYGKEERAERSIFLKELQSQEIGT